MSDRTLTRREHGWDLAETASQVVAACATVGLAAVMLTHTLLPPAPPMDAPKPTEVALSVVEEAPPPPPPPEIAPPPVPEPPPPPPQVTAAPLPPPPPPRPRHIVRPKRPPPPHPVVTQEVPPDAPPRPPSDNVARISRQAPANHSAEAAYIGRLHGIVARNTEPPTGAAYRLSHPSGEVQVAFTLARNGAVSDLRVLRSSGSPLLDRQALAIVAGQRYPAIPDDVYPDAASHAFSVPVAFPYTGGSDNGL